MFTFVWPFQRSDHSRKACLYLEINQDTLMSQLQRSGTLWYWPVWCIQRCWSPWNSLGHPANHYCKEQHFLSQKKTSLPASCLKETRETALSSLRYDISLVTASQRWCVKQNAMSIATAVICPVSDNWHLKQKQSILLTKKWFTVWKEQCP